MKVLVVAFNQEKVLRGLLRDCENFADGSFEALVLPLRDSPPPADLASLVPLVVCLHLRGVGLASQIRPWSQNSTHNTHHPTSNICILLWNSSAVSYFLLKVLAKLRKAASEARETPTMAEITINDLVR